MVFENIDWMKFVGKPAVLGLICMLVTQHLFRRPTVSIAAGIFGALIGLSI